MDRKGNWIQTYTGKKIYPFDPRPEEICIEDIAHALSNICRFTGHCKEFYSVAQHSVYVSVHVSPENALAGLLHDAAEAYLSDIATPIKDDIRMFYYDVAEATLRNFILAKFGVETKGALSSEIHEVDMKVLSTEARDLGFRFIETGVPPFPTHIHPQQPKDAERTFMDWFQILQDRKIISTQT